MPTNTAPNVYEKLNMAREAFHKSKLNKSGHNKFAGYKYFELSDFIIPALDIFQRTGLSGIVSFGTTEATLTITNIDNLEEKIVISSPMSTASLKGCHEVQNLGAVQTYLRRYLWVAALEIVEHDALDATTGRKGDGTVVKPLPDKVDVSEERKSVIHDVADAIKQHMADDDELGAYEEASGVTDSEEKIYLWSLLDSKTRSTIKRISAEIKE